MTDRRSVIHYTCDDCCEIQCFISYVLHDAARIELYARLGGVLLSVPIGLLFTVEYWRMRIMLGHVGITVRLMSAYFLWAYFLLELTVLFVNLSVYSISSDSQFQEIFPRCTFKEFFLIALEDASFAMNKLRDMMK